MKIKKLNIEKFFLALFLIFFNSTSKADQVLPNQIYGSYKFVSRAGNAVIGDLKIANEYVSYGREFNYLCSSSYKVNRLPDSINYPNNLKTNNNEDIFYETYNLILDKAENSNCSDTLQISIQHKHNKKQSIKEVFFLETPSYVEKISLVTYKDNKLNGVYSIGWNINEYNKRFKR